MFFRPKPPSMVVSLSISEHYAHPGQEHLVLASLPSSQVSASGPAAFLTRAQVQEAFPSGLIASERFRYQDQEYKIVTSTEAGSNRGLVCLAVPAAAPASAAADVTADRDSAPPSRVSSPPRDQSPHLSAQQQHCGQQHSNNNSAAAAASSTRSTPTRPAGSAHLLATPIAADHSSAVINSFANLTRPVVSVSGAGLPPLTLATNTTGGGGAAVAVATSSGGPSAMVPAADGSGIQQHHQHQQSLQQQLSDRGRFIEDLLAATESPIPLERYKALMRLSNGCRRGLRALGLRDPSRPESWQGDEAQEVYRSVVLVGECLARFGTADFGQCSNSSRAVTSRDYAALLTQFLRSFGPLFADDFIAGLHRQAVADEAWTVRCLLATRCDANDLIFGQLIRHVGLEGKGDGGGGATVINTSVVTANPTNACTSAPQTLVNAVSSAKSKVLQKGPGALLGLALAAGGLFLLRHRLAGAAGVILDSGGGGSGSGSHYRHGRNALNAKLVSDKVRTERLAVRAVSACDAELTKAARNAELLQDDWRLGRLRLSLLNGGPLAPVPPGYEPLDARACKLESFLATVERDAGSLERAVAEL